MLFRESQIDTNEDMGLVDGVFNPTELDDKIAQTLNTLLSDRKIVIHTITIESSNGYVFNTELCKAIIGAPSIYKIENLDITITNNMPEGFRTLLLDAIRKLRLKSLMIDSLSIGGDSFVEFLGALNGERLEELHVTEVGLTNDNIGQLAAAISEFPVLKAMSFRYNDPFDVNSLVHFSNIVRHPSMRDLDISATNVYSDGDWDPFFAAVANSNMEFLNFGYSDDDFAETQDVIQLYQSFANWLPETRLKSIDLNWFCDDDDTILQLANAISATPNLLIVNHNFDSAKAAPIYNAVRQNRLNLSNQAMLPHAVLLAWNRYPRDVINRIAKHFYGDSWNFKPPSRYGLAGTYFARELVERSVDQAIAMRRARLDNSNAQQTGLRRSRRLAGLGPSI